MTFKISAATLNQLSQLTVLFNQYRIFYGKDSNESACYRFLFERIANNESVIFVAEHNEQSLGFVQLYPSFSSVSLLPTWILNDVYVLSDARRQGIAKALIQRCQEFVQEQQHKALSLETAPTNIAAKALYQQLGFELDLVYENYAWQNSNVR